MFKLLKIIAVLVVLLLLVFAFAIVSLVEVGAREAIVYGAASATKTEVTLDSVDVGFFSSNVVCEDLVIKNPEGFKTDHLFRLARFEIALSMGDLMDDKIVITEIVFDGVEVTCELAGTKLNLVEVYDSCSGDEGGEGGEEASQPEDAEAAEDEKSRHFEIQQIRITNSKLTGAIGLIPGVQPVEIDLALEDVVIKDLGKDGAEIDMSGVWKELLQGLLKSAIKGVTSKVPGLEAMIEGGDGPTLPGGGTGPGGLLDRVKDGPGGLFGK